MEKLSQDFQLRTIHFYQQCELEQFCFSKGLEARCLWNLSDSIAEGSQNNSNKRHKMKHEYQPNLSGIVLSNYFSVFSKNEISGQIFWLCLQLQNNLESIHRYKIVCLLFGEWKKCQCQFLTYSTWTAIFISSVRKESTKRVATF